MKLFNINLNINSMKNILKLLLLAFIVILCIYILYISSFSTIEAFAESKDCSNCQIMPSSGNCIKLYDFSYTFYDNSPHEVMGLSFDKIDTSYVFCPYEPKCIGDDYIDNIMTRDDREELSNENISGGFGAYDITCCSGSRWFENNVSSYKDIYENINERNYTEFTSESISNKCSQFKYDFLSTFMGTDDNNLKFNDNYELLNTDDLTEATKNKLNIGLRNNNYSKIVSFCRTHDKNHPSYQKYMENKDFSGMLFLRNIKASGHILQDPKLVPGDDANDRIESVQELLDAQRMLSISMEQVDFRDEQGNVIRTETTISGETLSRINDLNKELEQLNPNDNKFKNKFKTIQRELAELYKDSDGDNIIEYTYYEYVPYKPNVLGDGLQEITPPLNANVNSYLLNEDEFLNCFGDVSNTQILRFASGEYADMQSTTGRDDFFGVKDDADYKTQQDAQGNKYSDIIDLSAEFRHLENVKMGTTAPTGVIDQYLRAINGFYEKQMANMLGPRTHAVNQQLVFENNGLQTKESTFFVYDNEVNNEYECRPSITGNDKFKTCGPSAYYSEFKP